MALFVVSGVTMLFSLQAAQADVAGTVRNGTTDEPLRGAVVSMTDANRQARVDSAGRYVFREVAPGPHHIAVRAFGYAPRTVHALVPNDGTLEINISLVPVNTRLATRVVRPIVTLREHRAQREPFGVDRRASDVAIRNNPMLTEPDVLLSVSGGTVVTNPEAPSGLNVRGGATDHVAYLLDGIPVFSPLHTAGVFSAWNPDAIASVTLSSSMPSAGDLAALSGAVSGRTRTPSGRLAAQGAMSTTQARMTIDGRVGHTDATALVSVREGLPSLVAPRYERGFVRGQSADRLGTFESALFGGRLHVLGFESVDRVHASAVVAEGPRTLDDPAANSYRWRSRSIGAEWRAVRGAQVVRMLGWRASSDAGATWGVSTERLSMQSTRVDGGLLASVQRNTSRSTTVAGLRVERSRTAYRIAPSETDARHQTTSSGLAASTFTSTAFAEHAVHVTDRHDIRLDLSAAAFRGRMYTGPRAQWQWQVSERFALTSSYARLHQFAQSLRNQESVTGTVFPAELYIGAGGPLVPVARSDQGLVSATFAGSSGVQVNAEVFRRRLRNVLVVAANSAEPFATRPPAIGDGVVRGLGINASLSRNRFGMVASYGLQRVRYATDRVSFVPEQGAVHRVDGGLTIHPMPSLSIRFGVAGALGRRSTPVIGAFEWEACNLRDRGCEFAGSPRANTAALGGTSLPGYLRADLGIRKHWHAEFGGRDVQVALFGAATNLVGRQNVLTYATDALSGTLGPVDMRPRAPLVVGLDWRF